MIALFGVFLEGGTLLLTTVRGYRQGCFFFAIAGIGASGMRIPIITMIQRWVSTEKKGFMIGLLSTSYGDGFALMGRLFLITVDAGPASIERFNKFTHLWSETSTGQTGTRNRVRSAPDLFESPTIEV